MKTFSLLSILLLMAAFTQVAAQTSTAGVAVAMENQSIVKSGPVASFDKTVFDFAALTQGHPETASFTLTNEGNEPLIISSANASCGCTNLTYAKDPILPGKSTSISVTYNAAAIGNFMKTVTVRTNASDQPVVLKIKGKVEPKKEESKS